MMSITTRRFLAALTVVLATALSTAALQATNVAYYDFDGGNGNDSSGYANHGTVGASLGYSAIEVPFGSGMALDATSSADFLAGMVTAPNSASLQGLNDQISISLWIKGDSGANDNWFRLMRKGNEGAGNQTWMLNRYSSSQDIGARLDTAPNPPGFNQNRVFNNSTALDNSWHHLAYLIDNGTISEYVDGSLTGAPQSYAHGGGLSNTEPLYIGGRNSSDNFVGYLDDIGLWNTALADGEVKAIYNLALTPTLEYDLGNAMQLFELSIGDSVVIGDIVWTGVDNLTSPVGQVVFEDLNVVLNLGGGIGVSGLLPVPEPSTFALLGLGMLGLVRTSRRHARKHARR